MYMSGTQTSRTHDCVMKLLFTMQLLLYLHKLPSEAMDVDNAGQTDDT
jgi:hypothetical protein